jgi:hypothetical protein
MYLAMSSLYYYPAKNFELFFYLEGIQISAEFLFYLERIYHAIGMSSLCNFPAKDLISFSLEGIQISLNFFIIWEGIYLVMSSLYHHPAKKCSLFLSWRSKFLLKVFFLSRKDLLYHLNVVFFRPRSLAGLMFITDSLYIHLFLSSSLVQPDGPHGHCPGSAGRPHVRHGQLIYTFFSL